MSICNCQSDQPQRVYFLIFSVWRMLLTLSHTNWSFVRVFPVVAWWYHVLILWAVGIRYHVTEVYFTVLMGNRSPRSRNWQIPCLVRLPSNCRYPCPYVLTWQRGKSAPGVFLWVGRAPRPHLLNTITWGLDFIVWITGNTAPFCLALAITKYWLSPPTAVESLFTTN